MSYFIYNTLTSYGGITMNQDWQYFVIDIVPVVRFYYSFHEVSIRSCSYVTNYYWIYGF